MKKLLLFLIIWMTVFISANSQSFIAILPSYNNLTTDVGYSAVDWGDYNNDGFLDILLTGNDGSFVSKVYLNNGDGTFTDIYANIDGVSYGSVDWGDYDNDGDLDILLTGVISAIYRNDGNDIFTNINANLTIVSNSSVAWGDYDNDGDLDVLLTGDGGGVGFVSHIYRNDGNDVFTNINANLIPISHGSVAWGDYDNDGDLDIIITGEYNPYDAVSKIYRNDGNDEFVDISANIINVWWGSVAWGDYDSDGDLDILLTGNTGNPSFNIISKIYKNNGDGTFTDTYVNIANVWKGSVAWGDYDNDGDLDFILSGRLINTYDNITKIYRNDGNNNFTDINETIAGVEQGSIVWGDYDNDNDLDFLLTGITSTGGSTTILYRNEGNVFNTTPNSPTGLLCNQNGSVVNLSWDKASDTETSQDGLSYNLRVGITTDSLEIVSPMSIISNGFRKIAQIGNTNHDTTWFINDLPIDIYYWSVQSIDNAFAGSSFATEQTFTILPTSDFTYPEGICISDTATITYNGNASDTATYYWDFANGNIISGTGQGPYQIQWQTSGAKNISLSVFENGLYSDTTYHIVNVDTTFYFIELDTICSGDSIQWQGNYYNTAGTHYANYSTINGCDSIYELQLIINPIPEQFIISGEDTVMVNQIEVYNVPINSDVTYFWEVQNGIIINQISNSSAEIKWPNLGIGFIYVFAENQYGCLSDTASLEIIVGTIGIDTFFNNPDIAIYPNPFDNSLTVDYNKEFVLEIYDISGHKVFVSKNKKTDVSSLKIGIYIILVKNQNDKVLKIDQFVKN